jgi:hypothetical protein
MTARVFSLTLAVTLSAAVASFVSTLAGRQQVFRTNVTGVAVHVQVAAHGRAVSNLEASDFVMTDSGVPQEITAIDAADVPLDVSIVAQQTLWLGGFVTGNYRAEVSEIGRLMKRGDRLRVVLAGDQVIEVVPLSAPGIVPELPRKEEHCSAVYDGLASVLMRPAGPGRRHVVVVLTRGEGDGNAISHEVLMDLARRSDASVHALVTEWEYGKTIGVPARYRACAHQSADWDPRSRSRLRAISGIRELDPQRLALFNYERQRVVEIAEATGGGEIRKGLFSRSIRGPVEQALKQARSGYVLYYSPKGVRSDGWHPIQVTVARPGKFDVQVRPGYMR